MTTETKIEIVPLPLQLEEKELLAPGEKLSVSEWAEQKRILSAKTSSFDGPWNHEYTPFLVEIMNCLSDAVTRQVTVVKCSQSGGTEAGLNFLGRTIDQAPAPTLIVMPTEADANRRVNTRIKPMFESTPGLTRHLAGGRVDNLNIGKETVLDNMILYLGWAGSAAALGDNPVCHVILDEVGKFPAKSGKEADPVGLAKKRQRTFYSRSKLYCISTPVLENDLIDREFNGGTMENWWFECPKCGQFHIPNWSNLELDKDTEGSLLTAAEYEAGGHARYVCPACKSPWTEQDRWAAVCAGKWVPKGCIVEKGGRIIGNIRKTTHRSFIIPSLMIYPGFQKIDDLAAEWADAQVARRAGDVGPLQNFINSQLAQPWAEYEKQTDQLVVTRHVGGYSSGTVPEGVMMITAGADVQIDHVWLTVTGWGYLSECWTIFDGRIETGDTKELDNFELLRSYLNKNWPGEKDPQNMYRIYTTAIDCNYRPEVIKDFRNRCTELDIIAVRGDDSVRTRIYRASGEPGPEGMTKVYRYDLNVNMLKNTLYRLLFESPTPGPGWYHLPKDVADETLGQLTSEEQIIIRRGKKTEIFWKKKDTHRANHLWDARVYCLFAAQLRGAMALPDPAMLKKQRAASKAAATKTAGEKRGSFLDGLPKL